MISQTFHSNTLTFHSETATFHNLSLCNSEWFWVQKKNHSQPFTQAQTQYKKQPNSKKECIRRIFLFNCLITKTSVGTDTTGTKWNKYDASNTPTTKKRILRTHPLKASKKVSNKAYPETLRDSLVEKKAKGSVLNKTKLPVPPYSRHPLGFRVSVHLNKKSFSARSPRIIPIMSGTPLVPHSEPDIIGGKLCDVSGSREAPAREGMVKRPPISNHPLTPSRGKKIKRKGS